MKHTRLYSNIHLKDFSLTYESIYSAQLMIKKETVEHISNAFNSLFYIGIWFIVTTDNHELKKDRRITLKIATKPR